MRAVIYSINGIETKSYSEKVALEQKFGTRAETILREVREATPPLSPIRKAMIEQFGFVSAKFKDKVVV